MGEGDICSFTVDVDAWVSDSEAESHMAEDETDDSGSWSCQRPVPPDRERCAFHPKNETDALTGTEVVDALRDSIDHLRSTAGERQIAKKAPFATLREPDFTNELVESSDNHPIDLRHANIVGDVDFTGAVVRERIIADGIDCGGSVMLTDAVVEREFRLDGAIVAEDVELTNADINGRFSASDARIRGCIDGTDLSAGDNLVIRRTMCDGPFRAHGMNCSGDVLLDEAEMGEIAWSNVTIHGEVLATDSIVDGDVNLWNARFHDPVRWQSVVVAGEFVASNSLFESVARFTDASLGLDPTFESAEFESVEISGIRPHRSTIDLSEAHISNGVLDASGAAVDLTGATVGDVSFTRDGPIEYQRYRIENTAFDGFDFRDADVRRWFSETDWFLHGAPYNSNEKIPPETLESTYLKAKNGAEQVGDTKAAGEFFRREMIARRRRRWQQALRADSGDDSGATIWRRIGWVKKAAGNALFGLVAGHGERPGRTVLAGVGTIVFFSALFGAVWPAPAPPYGSPIGYLILSLESFVTLVLGGSEQVGYRSVRLIAQIEAFIGAFLIALFVFALTRSVHR